MYSITTRDKAELNAKNRLNGNPGDLVDEIERAIKSLIGNDIHVAVRGGGYEPRVVEEVSRLYQSAGWKIQFDGYWLDLT